MATMEGLDEPTKVKQADENEVKDKNKDTTMASNLAAISDVECPVCHEDLNEPKLLPCNHLVCKACLLTWLNKQGGQGGCPLCRAPVLTSAGNIQAQVDALPTNLAVMSLVESQKLLQGPHKCGACSDPNDATSFCMQCDVKLCCNCLKVHSQLPYARNHVTETLAKLTTRRLAERNRATCKVHPDKSAEIFCSAHQELICILCGTTRHEGCTGKKMIDDLAEEKRAELKQRTSRMKQKEQQIEKQIQEAKDMFKAMRLSSKMAFDGLQKNVEERRQQVERDILMQEEATMASLKSLETSRAALVNNARTVESLMESSSGDALLAMLSNLTTRLDDVERKHGGNIVIESMTLCFEQEQISGHRELLAQLGKLTTVAQSPANVFRSKDRTNRQANRDRNPHNRSTDPSQRRCDQCDMNYTAGVLGDYFHNLQYHTNRTVHKRVC